MQITHSRALRSSSNGGRFFILKRVVCSLQMAAFYIERVYESNLNGGSRLSKKLRLHSTYNVYS